VPFKRSLAEMCVVETAKSGSQTPQGSDQTELRRDEVSGVTETRLFGELETILSLTLRLTQWITGGKKVCIQVIEAVHGGSEITGLGGCVESHLKQRPTILDVFHPWQGILRKPEIGTSLESLQASLLDQPIAELAQAECSFIVTVARPRYLAEEYISDTRAITMSPLEAEVDRTTHCHCKQVRIGKQCRRIKFGQNIHGRKRCGILHQRLLEEILDRTTPKRGPDPLVFLPRFFIGRMRRPFDTQMAEVVETGGNSAVGPIERRVQVDPQAFNRSSLDRTRAARR